MSHQWTYLNNQNTLHDHKDTNEVSSQDVLSPPQINLIQPDPNVWNTIQALIQQSNNRMEQMEQWLMDRFTQLEERLVKALQDLRESTDDRFSAMQTEIQNLKEELQKDISEQMNEKYAKLEGSVANTHAEFMVAKVDIKQQMKDLNKVQDKTKEVVHLVHEARNKYMLAMQESM